MVISKGLRQAYDMQDFTYSAAMALREELTTDGKVRAPDKEQAAMIASLNKAWKDAQEQIRIHRGKPLPGSLTHEKVKRGPRRRELSAGLSSMLDDMPANETSGADESSASGPMPAGSE